MKNVSPWRTPLRVKSHVDILTWKCSIRSVIHRALLYEEETPKTNNWSDCTPVWVNSSVSKMFQRENFLQNRPRKTKLTQNCRARQALTDNDMDNKRYWSVVLVCVEVQNPGQDSTCKYTPNSRKKITTKKNIPHTRIWGGTSTSWHPECWGRTTWHTRGKPLVCRERHRKTKKK